MTCPQCGTEHAADARLCRHCGATLPEGPQPVPLRLQHVAASRLCLLTATVSTAGLVLFLLLTLLFPAMQHGFHELAASVGVLLPKDGRLFGGAAFFFFLPSAALCAGLWLAWRAARKEEPVPLTAYRAFRAAAWMEFVLLTVLCLPLHLYLFPFHLPDFARSRVLSGYIGLLIIWAISLVYFCVSRRFLRALGWRTLREKQGTGPCSVMLGINVLLALAMVLGAFSGLFSESLFSGFFPLAFFDGLCRGGGGSGLGCLGCCGVNAIGHGVDFALLLFGGLPGFLQDAGQGCLDVSAVAAALAADGNSFLVGVERTAGAEPAVFGILRDAGQHLIVGAGLKCAGNRARQHTGGLQADTLIITQIHAAAVQESTVLLNFHAGNRRIADKHSVIGTKQFAGLHIELLIIEIILAQDLTRSIFALEVDDKAGQRFCANILKGQADRNFTRDIPFQQLNTDKLDRAAGSVIIGTGLRHQGKILIHCVSPCLNFHQTVRRAVPARRAALPMQGLRQARGYPAQRVPGFRLSSGRQTLRR